MRYTKGTGPNVLVVDPDDEEAESLVALLEDDGYRVSRSRDGRAAYDLASAQPPDLVILDLVLPDLDGLALYVDLKLMTGAPVIVCSATKRRRDRPLGFKLGVDDFVAKPFDWEDFEGRIEATLRRAPNRLPGAPPDTGVETAPEEPTAVDRPSLVRRLGTLKRVRHRTLIAGRDLALTPTEHRLLSTLLSRPDEFVPREELAQAVWGYDDDGIAQAISVHMHRLRTKLATAEWRGGAAPTIKSVRGRGYSLRRALPADGAQPGSPRVGEARSALRLVHSHDDRTTSAADRQR